MTRLVINRGARISALKRRRWGSGIVLGAIALIGSILPAAYAQTESGAATRENVFSSDHVLVKLSPGVSAAGVVGPDNESVFDRWRRVPVPAGKKPEEVVADLRTREGVEVAELDHVIQLDPMSSPVPLSHLDPIVVNDPGYDFQWHFPAVQLDEAWARSTGEDVIVAVVDSGISQEGEDLACHTFVSPYNARSGTTGATAADDNGHGTHVAGTVAQCTDNGVGVAGVAFDASLMPVKVLNANGDGLFSDIADGINWAHAHGADVINLSLGCDGCTSTMIDEAIEAAVADGVVVVAASGNKNLGLVSYPANHPDVIAVGATELGNERAPYSNTGSALDLVAPGGNLDKDEDADGFDDGVLQETFVPGQPTPWGYWFFEGTSMATPHVSGAAALLLSLNPELSPTRVREVLVDTALDLGSAGHDTLFGHGLIQLHDALEADLFGPRWSQEDALHVEEFGERSLTLVWDAASDNVAVTEYQLRRRGTTLATTAERRAKVSGLQPGTAYEFEVLARDEVGNWSEALPAALWTADAFVDTPGTTFYNDILWLSGSRITRGCNPPANDLFCPDDSVTRGQVAAFLVRALGLTVEDHPGFDDVPGSSTFARDIARLATAGITRGCNPPANDLFCPDDSVTRGQVAAFLVRALGLTVEDHPGFDDVPSSSTFANDIARLATAGITRGCNPPANDRFCPERPISRGELAAFLHRALAG